MLKKTKNFLKNRLSAKQKQTIRTIISKIKLFFYKKDIGKGSYIDKTVHVTGWKNVHIGNNTGISEHTWLNINNRVGDKKHIHIGDNCYIGRRNFFSSGDLISIGDYFMSGVDCKIIGADHIVNNPFLPYASTGAISKGSVVIESNVWLGASVSIVGDVTIGRGSIIGAGSLVNKDIPPFSIAIGSPSRVIKRYDFNNNKWVDIESYDNNIIIPSENEYRQILQKIDVSIPFIACGKSQNDFL